MDIVLAVAGGGAIGAVGRVWLNERLAGHPPWATAIVNVLGSLLAGGGIALLAGPIRAFVVIGLCGALTTFSTFAYETVTFARDGRPSVAAVYGIGTVITCTVAFLIGSYIGAIIG